MKVHLRKGHLQSQIKVCHLLEMILEWKKNYRSKIGHLSKYFYKKKSDNAKHKHRRNSGHFDLKNLKLFFSNVAFSVETNDVNAWFVDSGASVDIKCNNNWYHNFKETRNGANIYLGDVHAYQIKEYGDILATLSNGSSRNIHNVIYVPQIKKNLIYVSTILHRNLKFEFFKTHCIVKDLLDHCKLVSSGVSVGGLYKLDVTNKSHQALTYTTVSTKLILH